MYLLDIRIKSVQGAATSAEQHPWPISTVTVDDFSGRPNFCSRGTLRCSLAGQNFEDPTYGRLLTSAWFDAGIRVTDIRDPYHPTEVGISLRRSTRSRSRAPRSFNGVTYTALDVSCDTPTSTIVDCAIAATGGRRTHIVRLTGEAEEIARGNGDD